jgi:hypothetical protein
MKETCFSDPPETGSSEEETRHAPLIESVSDGDRSNNDLFDKDSSKPQSNFKQILEYDLILQHKLPSKETRPRRKPYLLHIVTNSKYPATAEKTWPRRNPRTSPVTESFHHARSVQIKRRDEQ